MKCLKCQADNADTLKFCGECGTRLTLQDQLSPPFTKTLETPIQKLTRGTLFAHRYEIIEELGVGGMGEHEKALDQIDYLLSIPYWFLSVASLQIEPTWEPLHDHPRFKQILKKYSKME